MRNQNKRPTGLAGAKRKAIQSVHVSKSGETENEQPAPGEGASMNLERPNKKARTAKKQTTATPQATDSQDVATAVNTAVAGTSATSPAVKKTRGGEHPVAWSDAEKLKLRELRASRMWFKWPRAVRTAKLNDWLAKNEFTHKRTADAIDQCAEGWRKNPSTDPLPNGEPLLSKARWKEVDGQRSELESSENAATPHEGEQEAGDGQKETNAEISEEKASEIVKRHLTPLLMSCTEDGKSAEGGNDDEPARGIS